MGPEEEAELLARCREGEVDAWDELFDTHHSAAAAFVFQLGLGLSPEDVEDICQEMWLSAISHIESFQGSSRFQTWLFRIAANKARDHRERNQAAKRGGGKQVLSLDQQNPETGQTLDPPTGQPGPDLVLASAEQIAILRSAMDQLSEACREIIEMRYFGEVSYEEISRAMGLNPKTVSSRLSKCLDRLEEIMQKLFSRADGPIFPSKL